jgi:hypothetical protein
MTKGLFAASAIVLAAVASGCASAQAKGDDHSGLAIPPPPPHVVPITAEPIIEPVGEIPASGAGAPANRTTTRPPRETPAKPPAAESKPDAKPPDTKPADQPAPPEPAAPAAAAPPPQLRTPESSGAETAVRGTIDRTRGLLNSVDYRRLTAARKKAYDQAKAFAQQAEDALKAGNVVFAQSVAAKAETLAKDLAGQ